MNRKDSKTLDLFDALGVNAGIDDESCVDKNSTPNPANKFDAMIDQYNEEKSRIHTGHEMYFAFGNTVIHHAWKRDTPEPIKRT